jgi:hypothetical protein
VEGEAVFDGRILSEDGVPVPGATVFITPLNLFAITDYLGKYRIGGVPTGNYTITAVHGEFQVASEENLRVVGAATKNCDLELVHRHPSETVRNPGFEEVGPARGVTYDWIKYGRLDGLYGARDNSYAVQPHRGTYMLGAEFPGGKDGYGGVMQRVRCSPEQAYELSCHIHTGQAEGSRVDAFVRIGVDPEAGLDPLAPSIDWSEPATSAQTWTRIDNAVEASQDTLTLFIEIQKTGKKGEVGVFVDEIALRRVFARAQD